MEAVQRVLNLTIFKLTQRYPWSPWLIVIYLVGLTAFAAWLFHSSHVSGDLIFALYCFAVIYVVTIYGEKAGMVIGLLSFLLYNGALNTHRVASFRLGNFYELIVEGIVLPVLFLLLSVYLGKIFLNSRQMNEETQALNRRLFEMQLSSERTLAGFILAMSRAIESKDPYTKGHSERVAGYSMLLADQLGMSEEPKKKLFYGALLHDIGKIGVPDSVLLKPGKLEPDEWVEMQLHPSIGKIVLEAVPGLEYVLDIVSLHHENLDGTGYPYGLQEDKIPLSARIVAIADSFDAITSDRPYRKGMTAERAISELYKFCGIRYERHLVDLFVKAMQARDNRLMSRQEFRQYLKRFNLNEESDQ